MIYGKKRTEQLFLKIFKNSIASLSIILFLFTGMSYTIFTILDNSKILNRIEVIGKVEWLYFKKDIGQLARLIIFDEINNNYINIKDNIDIIIHSMTYIEFQNVKILNFEEPEKFSANHVWIVSIQEDTDYIEILKNNPVLNKNFHIKFQILTRTKKLWQVIIEKII